MADLQKAAEDLAKADAERARLMAIRDDAILRAKESGLTWDQLQEGTGLAREAIAKTMRRLKKTTG